MLRKSYSWVVWVAFILSAFVTIGCGGSDDPSDGASFDVAGKVINKNNTNISNMIISFGEKAAAVTTDNNGSWAQSDLTGSVKITPESRVYEFEPTSRTVSSATDDIIFVAKAKAVAADPYDVSGRVTDAHDAPLSGVTLSFNDGTADVQTDSDGLWQATGLEGTVEITPRLAGYIFAPRSETVVDAAGDVNFVGTEMQALTVEVSPQSYQLVPEGSVELQATLSGTFAQEATLEWSVSPDAGSLSDTSGDRVTYTAGSNAGTVEITVTASTDDESVSAIVMIEVSALAVNIEASKSIVGFGETVNLTAEVAGAGADSAVFIWSATSGVLNNTTKSSMG